MPQDVLFSLDKAGRENNLNIAFEIVDDLYSKGKDLGHFIEMLVNHFRTLLLIKLSGKEAPFITLSQAERERYAQSAAFYTREQCLTAIDLLVEAQNQIRFSPSPKIALEALLLRILQLHRRISIDFLVKRLFELEKSIANTPSAPSDDPHSKRVSEAHNVTETNNIERIAPKDIPIKTEQTSPLPYSITEDPTPSKADLGIREAKIKLVSPAMSEEPLIRLASLTTIHEMTPTSKETSTPVEVSVPLPQVQPAQLTAAHSIKKQSRYDTLLQFAAIELEGSLQKKPMGGH